MLILKVINSRFRIDDLGLLSPLAFEQLRRRHRLCATTGATKIEIGGLATPNNLAITSDCRMKSKCPTSVLVAVSAEIEAFHIEKFLLRLARPDWSTAIHF